MTQTCATEVMQKHLEKIGSKAGSHEECSYVVLEQPITAYTLKDLKSAWIAYTTGKVLRVLKEGKWHTQEHGASPSGATEAKALTYDKRVIL